MTVDLYFSGEVIEPAGADASSVMMTAIVRISRNINTVKNKAQSIGSSKSATENITSVLLSQTENNLL